MSNKKKVDLVTYFLKTSPVSHYRSFTSVVRPDESSKDTPAGIQADQDYVYDFMNRLDVFGVSNANFTSQRSKKIEDPPHFRKLFPSRLVMKKSSPGSQEEPQQLEQSIRLVSAHTGYSIIPFQQLEQRLQIASPKTIGEIRTKLIYLFKFLINKRDKISPESLELDANLQLSRTIIDSLSRTQNGEQQENWKQLEAMEKLLRAREYQKKGLRAVALSNFEEIFRDEAASAKTRLQALKVLCSSGEQLGDPKMLESLISETQARGEKEYQEIILTSIRRIKEAKH